MELENQIKEQLESTLQQTDFPSLGKLQRGKVRDVYHQQDQLVIITTDRVSAFDHVLGTIPFKGELLTALTHFWFKKTANIVTNHIIDMPDPNVLIVKKCRTLPVEVIIRGYITGSLWRDYQKDGAPAYGITFPGDLKKDQKFTSPIITPTTKAQIGEHDLPISREEIIDSGLVNPEIYTQVENIALQLFKCGSEWADSQGLILVDTKYEFGLDQQGEVMLIDEIHTPDSSRYWQKEYYQEKFQAEKNQVMLDKENIRQWLRERGFSGHGTPPALSDDIRIHLSKKYLQLYQTMTGETYTPHGSDPLPRLQENLKIGKTA